MKPFASSILVAVMNFAALPVLAQNNANPAAPAPSPGFSPGYGPMWGYGPHHFWGWGFHPFGAIFAILLILFFIAVLLRMFGIGRWGRMHYHGYGRGGTALDILEERFARGEIDKNEFEEKRKLLMR